ncbi:MAG: U32 family peptidase [Candidatus Methanomethylophilaceae archaeon]|nr:U32 family peptidase [Candidatus Methanomethylophilaceae archaeon]
MEILAPVGTPESLSLAIAGGADAVYLAGKSFGARAFAGNFSDSELEGAVGYAHDNGVKVYVTVNTLIKNSEMADAVSLVGFLDDIGADAVLIQDLGLLSNIQRYDIPKHASTQMQVHSLEGLKWCAENGIQRAVLARELTFEELSRIVPDSPVETEVFIQGALCYCMSGGCLMSSFIGGRSGNRGSCAQPCRKKYTTETSSGYLLSCADLYGMDYIEKLRDIGVDSLKIEGRMRSPAYAYLSTHAYHLAEQGDFGEEFQETVSLLKTVFNRGTCEGYLGGVVSPVQPVYPDNRGYRLGRVKVSNRVLDVSAIDEPIGLRDGLSLFSGDAKVGGFKVSDLESIRTPFKINNGTYDLYRTYDPRLDIVKNKAKTPKLKGSTKRPKVSVDLPRANRSRDSIEKTFYLSTVRCAEAAIGYADRIVFDNPDRIDDVRELCANNDVECVRLLPRFDAEDGWVDDGNPVMVNNVSQLYACKSSKEVYASSVFNAFNSYNLDRFRQVTLSPELARGEVSDLVSKCQVPVEVMAFGRTELMYSRDPSLQNGAIVDELGASFPVYRDKRGFAHILNSIDLCLIDLIPELMGSGVASVGLDLRKRPHQMVAAVGEACLDPTGGSLDHLVELCGGRVTKGLYVRGV